MPFSSQFLLASPRRLALAIALFVVLDLSVLLINLWIADQVSRDAVAINLAGRQRMLSQQITKSLLLANHATDEGTRTAARAEFTQSLVLFTITLRAFDQGGGTMSGEGKAALLRRVHTAAGRAPLEAALRIIAPLTLRLGASAASSPEDFHWAMDYMVAHNREILADMNQLTSALERHSVSRIETMRLVQSGAFVLAMLNFLVIVLGLVKQYHHVEKDGHHWREMAQRDLLTGLYNRVALREALTSTLERAAREGKTLAVLFLDLDGFKAINDQYGHASGDELLETPGRPPDATGTRQRHRSAPGR